MAQIKAIGNAGFCIEHHGVHVAIDPFVPAPFRGLSCVWEKNAPVDLILITHAHWDHFQCEEVAARAEANRAVVIGPRNVTRELQGRLHPSAVVEMEPPQAGGSATIERRGVTVTAFRTPHGRAHNSYLIEWPDLRLFHDGDNEDTRALDRERLKGLDAVMLCPWKGSDWVEFLDTIRPRRWFLMHLTEEEYAAQERGEFFTDRCERVPDGLVVLRPGQSMSLEV